MIEKVVTIGVYGFTDAAFFEALQSAGVDTFCDVRARRGVRGSEYVFANSQRLQKRLAELGIAYRHFPELAPSDATRKRQHEVDKQTKVARRKREELSEAFVDAYTHECLEDFDAKTFVENVGRDAKIIVLFCVERKPEACHRSLLANALHDQLGVPVEHVMP